MSTSSAWASATNWLSRNLVLHALFSRAAQYLLVRYEDIARNPKSMLRKIGEFVGEAVNCECFDDDHVIVLGEDHVFSGNPMRSTIGGISIRIDDAWRMHLGRIDRLLVTAATWPLLLRYGYVGPLRGAARSR